MRPGDWSCMQCGNHNFADKIACNRCGVPKGSSGAAGYGGAAALNVLAAGYAGAGGQRPGDWQCYSCGNNNFASRDACNRCGIPKTTFIAKSGMRPGDWLCPSCQNHNYASRAACTKCQTPWAAEYVHQGNMKAGDWICTECNNHNYADKVQCNKCQVPKQPHALTAS